MSFFKKPAPVQNMRELKKNVRINLENAKKTNKYVINTELKKLRYNRQNNTKQDLEKDIITRIKIAYYQIHIVNRYEDKLDEVETVQQLNQALNNITTAANLINWMSIKGPKANVDKFVRNNDKLNLRSENYSEDLEERIDAFKDSGIGSIVSDSLIDDLISGASSLDECIDVEKGIMMSAPNLTSVMNEQYDLSKLNDSFQSNSSIIKDLGLNDSSTFTM